MEPQSFAIAGKSPLLDQAKMVLDSLASQEVELIMDLEHLFKRAQKDHIERIDKLQHSIPNMDKVGDDIRRLSALVDCAFTEVEDVCKEFRRIDLAKARVDDCIAKLDDILHLRMCRDGVSQAMKLNNFEQAAIHIKRYLSIDQDRLRKTIGAIHGRQTGEYDFTPKKSVNLFDMNDDLADDNSLKVSNLSDDATVDPHSMELALRELDEVRSRLSLLCRENFARAIRNNDTREIERFFKIFPMLNEHQLGLSRYAEYLQCKIVDEQLNETFRSKQVDQASKLAALYESIARLIDSHQPVVETHYGPGKLIIVVRILQKECDRLSRKILEEFRDETKLQSVAKIVKGSTFHQAKNPVAGSNFQIESSKIDPRNIDNIINEISLITSRSEVYMNFIVQRLRDDLESNCESDAQRQAGLLEIYNLACVDCELNHLIQEVCSIYVMLEQYYLNESSKKAIMLDQIELEATKCYFSSMLDDIFFIIKKCTKRAISTKSNEAFCAIINHCVALLESTFSQVLQERIKNYQYTPPLIGLKNLDLSSAYSAIQSGRYLQSSSEVKNARAQYFSALNNLNKACDYIQTLKGMLDNYIKNLKPSLLLMDKQKDNQVAKSATCLDELSQLVNRFKSIVDNSLYQLFNSALKDRIKSELKMIMTENPDLTYSPEEATSLAEHLLDTLDSTLVESLTAENNQKLMLIVTDFLASTMKSLQ